ncbi:hypothetical protein M422DRAFT_275935 [Sphaerobolus stellatus SS14]|uniref:Uncharacterized protein n=1 Tax=Sphaerobolus stellatus (strain SS14) TaxID=990650 RepID=A0A0C9UDI2_SPHS4|nr:hypothetical protein M422DRAFT_275935 [Sphaerobolus stellatus SS14]
MALILDTLHLPLHHDLSYLVTFNLIIDYIEDIYANDYRLTVLWDPIENLGQTSMYMHKIVLHVCCIIFGTSPSAPGLKMLLGNFVGSFIDLLYLLLIGNTVY